MKNQLQNILSNYPTRFSKRQKRKFLYEVTNIFDQEQIKYQITSDKKTTFNNNLFINNLEGSKNIFITHYDSKRFRYDVDICNTDPFIAKRKNIFLLDSLLGLGFGVFIIFAIVYTFKEFSNYFIVIGIALFGMIGFNFFRNGQWTFHNSKNDYNQALRIALELAFTLSKNDNAFILIDNHYSESSSEQDIIKALITNNKVENIYILDHVDGSEIKLIKSKGKDSCQRLDLDRRLKLLGLFKDVEIAQVLKYIK